MFSLLSACLLICLLAAHLWTLYASPLPQIDVFLNITRAADFFLHGKNPYSQVYPELYSGASYPSGFTYFPGTLLWLTPFRILGDIRYGVLAAQIISVAAIFRLSRLLRIQAQMKFLLAGLWLSLPVSLFVMEQGWTEPVLASLFLLSLCMYLEKWWVPLGIVLGLSAAVKQYMFLLPLFALISVWRNEGAPAARKVGVSALLSCLLLGLPFALSDWKNFYEMTVRLYVMAPVRMNSYNLLVYFGRHWQWAVSPWLQFAMASIGASLGIWISWRNGIERLATALLLAYSIFFFFGKWAFTNYYYLFASYVIAILLFKLKSREME